MERRGARATTAVCVAVLLVGLSVLVYGIIRNDLARSFGGACLTVPALTVLALLVIRRWVVDASSERLALAEAQREAEAEQSRYLAARAALENEQGRLTRDMTAERIALAARLKAERDQLQTEFDARRGELMAEAMEVTMRMVRGGKLAPAQPPSDNLIRFPGQFPVQQDAPQPERARSREHGVGGP